MHGQPAPAPSAATGPPELVAHVWCNFSRAEPELLICRRDAAARHGIIARHALTEQVDGLPWLVKDPGQPPHGNGFRYNDEVGAESTVLRASEDTLTLLGFRTTGWEKQAPEFYVAGLTPLRSARRPGEPTGEAPAPASPPSCLCLPQLPQPRYDG